ncbi:hypothetical protein BS50DRAFT_673327 [Corynespora cassiicola Philippines]|uniref:Alpha-ketoglutarate-dependent dioxygenase AlkB-like domain-containing protein n=1 Tax=Corynespora cassiicola Philippines TaxID=1448308 RepID=A0A2T2P4T0_CORCC|nr:hypothetical protein BS50DRAFT_673327 [Corynespora cassiicola Philippines]
MSQHTREPMESSKASNVLTKIVSGFLDAPGSPLSDCPDDISESSHGRAKKRLKLDPDATYLSQATIYHTSPDDLERFFHAEVEALSRLRPKPASSSQLTQEDSLQNLAGFGPRRQGQSQDLPLHISLGFSQAAQGLASQMPSFHQYNFLEPSRQPETVIYPSQYTQDLIPYTQDEESQILPTQNVPQSSDPISSPRLDDDVPEAINPYNTDLNALRDLSIQLLALCKSGDKPAPVAQPEVWAEGRQELCETLHYFRSYQGGCYSVSGLVRGFLFDKSAYSRDYIDDTVVISRAGGGLVRDKGSGEMRQGADQTEKGKVLSLRNCINTYNPVVISVGSDNPNMPSKPQHTYSVLDYFKPTHIWSEKSNGKTIVRYRFEKFNVNKSSWWQASNRDDMAKLGSLPDPLVQSCRECKKETQQIYLQGWMCLQQSCHLFWKLLPGDPADKFQEPNEDSLRYDPRWLKQKTHWPNEDDDYPLTSEKFNPEAISIAGEDNALAYWLGMVCPHCGRCILRAKWAGWECQNPQCSFKQYPSHIVIPSRALCEPHFPLSTSYTLSRDLWEASVSLTPIFTHNYRIHRYKIPGVDGFVAHMIANQTVVEEPGGPNDMFEELQKINIGLERRRMKTAVAKGDSYTRHFTGRNIEEISEEWKPREFNEVLALGYFQQQKINYHDDGEFGLGPTIATLSLGATGTMRLRMKGRHYAGVSNSGIYDISPPLPGCVKYKERLALHDELESLKAGDQVVYRERLRAVPKELQLKPGGKHPDVLTMELGHGDIVVMHGFALQKYYEHSVDHGGKLRFALTCRFIEPESLKAQDRSHYEVGPDLGDYDGTRLKSCN